MAVEADVEKGTLSADDVVALAKQSEEVTNDLLELAAKVEDGGPYRRPSLPNIMERSVESARSIEAAARSACPAHFEPTIKVPRDGESREIALFAVRQEDETQDRIELELFSSTVTRDGDDLTRLDKKILTIKRGQPGKMDLVLEIDDAGQVAYGPGYTSDDASQGFWETLAAVDPIREFFGKFDG